MYSTPEQYPKSQWVLAKGKPIDTLLLSGYDCNMLSTTIESFNSNYKLFKKQNAEVFAHYIGANFRNGPPKKILGS